MKLKNIAAVVIISGALVGVANAANPGAYVGGGLGYSNLENFSDASKTGGNGGLGATLFAGYNFNKYFGLEGGYRHYDKTKYEADDYNSVTSEYNLNAITLVGKGYLPLGENSPFNLYASLGIAEMFAKSDLSYGSYDLGSDSTHALVAVAGLGASYDINSHVTASIDYSLTGSKDGSSSTIGIPQTDLATFNLAYNFG